MIGERHEPRARAQPPPASLTPGSPGEEAPAPLRPAAPPATPIPVEVHQPPMSPLQVVERVLGSVWVPLETSGIVLVVLIFILLEHESVRDRFIRLAGPSDLRATTLVLNDAGERLSRFFVSQFSVNLGVGAVLWLGLAVIGLPHATLWAALAARAALRALCRHLDRGADLGGARRGGRSRLDLGDRDPRFVRGGGAHREASWWSRSSTDIPPGFRRSRSWSPRSSGAGSGVRSVWWCRRP